MLEVKHLKRVYKVKNGQPVYALDDVSVKFPETGLVFILGKSGSGKSTLLNVMGGLDKVDDGEIIINGKSSKEFSGSEMDSYRNTYLGFIFQEYNILNDFTVKENIGLALQLQHKKATDEEIDKILAEVDLTGYGKRKPNELSGGQKQRVAIARALVKEPKIIFGDEPTGALDSNTGRQVFETLKKLSKDKLVVIVSHDRDFAEHFGDRVIELKDGKVISDISKMSVEAKQEKPGVSILGNNVIRIEKGHALTVEDLEIINKTLANQQTDTFITADEHVNDAICEAARIDKSGNRQEFFATKNEDIKLNQEDFKLIKSNFSLHNAFRMGSRSLKVKPFRLVMTILLSAMSFTLFGTAFTLGLFNSPQAMTDTAISQKIKFSRFGANYRYTSYNTTNYLPDDEKAKLEDFGAKVFSVENNYAVLSNNIPDDDSINYVDFRNNNYYANSLNYVLEVTDTFLSDIGFSVTAGQLPKESEEIALTTHVLQTYEDFGFKDAIDSNYIVKTADHVTAEKIIGHYIASKDPASDEMKYYKITGFVDTQFPEETYKQYRKAETAPTWSDEGYSNLYSLAYSSLHCCAFVAPVEENVEEDKVSKTVLFSQLENDHVEFSYGNYKSHNAKYFFQDGKTVLANDEALINPQGYFRLLNAKYSEQRPDYQRNYTPSNVYSDYDQTMTMSRDFYSREEITNNFLPEVAINRVAREKYLDFKDNEIFEVYYSNTNAELYGYCDDSTYRDPNDSSVVNLPWKSDPSYTLSNDDHHIIYNIFKSYLFAIWGNRVLTAPFYSSITEYIQFYEQEFDTLFPMRNYEKEEFYNSKADNIFVEYCIAHAEEVYEAYKNHPNYIALANMFNGGSTIDKKSILRMIIERQLSSFSDVLTKYNNYFATAISDTIKKLNPSEESLSLRYYNGDGEEGCQITVVGFDFELPTTNYPIPLHMNLETTERLMNDSKESFTSESENYMVLLPKERAQMEKFFKYVEDRRKEIESYEWEDVPIGSVSFYFDETQLSSVQSLSYTLSILTNVFIYVGLGLAVFSMFLFYNFISISINNKKREIGILRAVGAKRGDVFKIFYSESFIIASINFLLSGASTLALCLALNNIFIQQAEVTFNIMTPNVMVFGILMALSLITSIISALIPVTRIANKKPIDAIQNR